MAWATGYWPSSFWPAGYWPGWGSSSTPTVAAARCDADVYAAIAAALRAAGRFGDVLFAREEQVDELVARTGNRLLIVPDDRVSVARETSPGRRLREATYELVLKVHGTDPSEASGRLQRLVAEAHNRLDGVEYTSYCLFDRSNLDSDAGRYDDPPNFVAYLKGRFAYVVDLSVGLKSTR